MSELTIPERVAAGAAWLDENRPGWATDIDLSKLDLAAPCFCVLGQLYGNYWSAATTHFETAIDDGDEVASEMGFNTHEDEADVTFTDLEMEWRRLIESRRSGAVS